MSLPDDVADQDLKITIQGTLDVYWVKLVDIKRVWKVDLYVNNLEGIKILYWGTINVSNIFYNEIVCLSLLINIECTDNRSTLNCNYDVIFWGNSLYDFIKNEMYITAWEFEKRFRLIWSEWTHKIRGRQL